MNHYNKLLIFLSINAASVSLYCGMQKTETMSTESGRKERKSKGIRFRCACLSLNLIVPLPVHFLWCSLYSTCMGLCMEQFLSAMKIQQNVCSPSLVNAIGYVKLSKYVYVVFGLYASASGCKCFHFSHCDFPLAAVWTDVPS